MMDFANPHFEEPGWLMLAVGAPVLLALLHRHAASARRRQLSRMASPRFVEELTRSHSPLLRGFKNALLLLAVACLGLALARPQWGELETASQGSGEDVMFIVDCSQSMLATDVLPTRLERSKLAILNFVRQHGRGRVGLVAFSGGAFLQCPLTHDYDAFDQALQAVDENTIPVAGTDIGRALNEASSAMDKKSHHKIIVLLTDGEDLEKTGTKAAESLSTNGVVIFAIGVGTPAGTEIRVLNQSGQPELLRDAKGEAVRSRLDERTLQAIAESSGGNYYQLGLRGEGLAHVRRAVETLGRAGGLTRTRGVERFYVPIAAGLLLLVAESLIGTRRRRHDGHDESTMKRTMHKTVIVGGVVICFCTTAFSAQIVTTNSPVSAHAPPAPKTTRDFYNAGTQQLNKGKLSDAETFLRAALTSQDEHIQPTALYNLGHVRFAQGSEELKKGPSASSVIERNYAVGQYGAQVAKQAQDALAANDVQRMVDAYKAGRGARKEAKAVIEAFNHAMETYAATLLKWQRSLGDFKSAAELNPSDTNAVHNARVVEEAIAKLLDSIRKMQQAMMPMPGGASEFNKMMNQMKGRIPANMMPPGAPGDDDEEMPMALLRGMKEGLSKDGEEQDITLSAEEAGNLLEGLRINEKRGLPVGGGEAAKPKDRTGRNW